MNIAINYLSRVYRRCNFQAARIVFQSCYPQDRRKKGFLCYLQNINSIIYTVIQSVLSLSQATFTKADCVRNSLSHAGGLYLQKEQLHWACLLTYPFICSVHPAPFPAIKILLVAPVTAGISLLLWGQIPEATQSSWLSIRYFELFIQNSW